MKKLLSSGYLSFILFLCCCLYGGQSNFAQSVSRPNIILIYTDDLGYGDLSCYGAVKLQTPNLDALAKKGIRFTNAHSTSATCTPSRYALLTGEYPWRREGTNILPGNANLIISERTFTLPKLLQVAGYKTAIVGKWHLGLGNNINKDWNGEIKPGPNEVGFDYSFIFPATADRIPTVFLENHHVVGLDLNDPITIDYKQKLGNEPTGKENSELLRMKATHGHDGTIINGIGRIGFMSGGKTTRWTDEEVPFTFLMKAKDFIDENKQHPFFLYYPMTEPHVPRVPATMFKGKSGLGARGDVILQLDWVVGQLIQHLQLLGIEKNTLLIFTSDNGPVLNDGYADDAVEKLNGHTPAGKLRGGKYSIFEGGNRVPFIVSWPGTIKPGVSDAMVSQLDFFPSFAKFTKQSIPSSIVLDSYDLMNALLGRSSKGRDIMVEHAAGLAIVQNNWKYIEPNNGPAYDSNTNTELGNSKEPQLYDLEKDIGEKNNLATTYPDKVKMLAALLNRIKKVNK